MINLAAARAEILSRAQALGAEKASLASARGRLLAEPVVAIRDYPAADVSAMDGYAVRAIDTAGATAEEPVCLVVSGESRAGHPASSSVGPGDAIRIFTGAVLPGGADGVVIQENTSPGESGQVLLWGEASAGAHIRRKGEGHVAGDELLAMGARITPAAIGLVASDGQTDVVVPRRPRVAIVGTGDELRAPGSADVPPEAVFDSNAPMLSAAVLDGGGLVTWISRVSDDPQALAELLLEVAEDADVLLTTGGASVGEHDGVAEAWERAGIETVFYKVALKPGKPLRFGTLDRPGHQRHDPLMVLALPGNPQAVLATFEQFVGPLLDRLGGGDGDLPLRIRLGLDGPRQKRAGRAQLVRGRRTGDRGQLLWAASGQGSHLLAGAARGDAVGLLGADQTELASGWPVDAFVHAEDLRGEVFLPTAGLPSVVAVRGDSGAGKTLLVEQLVAALGDRGKRVGTVKHASHPMALDVRGKDSWRHYEAGALAVTLLAPGRSVHVRREGSDVPPHRWLAPFAGLVDLVLVEGYGELPVDGIRVEVADVEAPRLEAVEGSPRRWLLQRPPEGAGRWPNELVSTLADALL